ncbi:MAG: signal peptidase II [Clostridia bacterium]|nr:signal peptidase II [Clostridia bacterium]
MIVVIIAVVVLALDRLSKLWVLSSLKDVGDIPFIDGILHWHYAENTGAAFSLMDGVKWFPIVVAVLAGLLAAGAFIYTFTRKYKMHALEIISIGLIAGGAVGNLIDRVQFGYVIDFIYFKLINFAIFNIADSALVVGSILMALYILFMHEKYLKKLNDEKAES